METWPAFLMKAAETLGQWRTFVTLALFVQCEFFFPPPLRSTGVLRCFICVQEPPACGTTKVAWAAAALQSFQVYEPQDFPGTVDRRVTALQQRSLRMACHVQ